MKRKRGRGKQKSKVVAEVGEKDTFSNNGAVLNSQEELALDDLVNTCGLVIEPQNGIRRSRSAQKKKVVDGTTGDSVRSFHEGSVAVSANLLNQPGGKKIISSRGLTSCNMEPSFNVDVVQDDRTHLKEQKRTRSIMSKSSRGNACSSADHGYDAGQVLNGLTRQEESYTPFKDPDYKGEELIAALKVLKKVMDMDAAEPFNVPVDAVALKIPDYFVIIKTPMDFGTICKNLEIGVKYKNSKDVLKDVQLIWDNCTKYNKKGHYILELMKRVKKNFTRLWKEAQLPNEQEEETYGHSPLPPANFSTSSPNECRNPLGSIAEPARHEQHDHPGMSGLQPHQSSLNYNQAHQHFQGTWHHQGSSVQQHSAQPFSSRNVGGSVGLVDDYSTRPQHSQTHWSHHHHQQQPSLSYNQAQQRSCCHPISQQVLPSHQQSGRFNTYEEPLHFPQESTMRSSPYGHQCSMGYMEDNRSYPRHTTQNQMGPIQPPLHQPTVSQCGPSFVQLQPPQPVACAAGANAGDTHSSPPEESMIRYVPRTGKHSLDPKSNINHQQQDEVLPSHRKLHQASSLRGQQHNPEQVTREGNMSSSPLLPSFGQPPLSPELASPGTSSAGNTYSPPVEESMIRSTKSAPQPPVGTADIASCQEQNYSTRTQQENHPGQRDNAVRQASAPNTAVGTGGVGSSRSKRGRGPTRYLDMWNMKGKIPISLNDLGQPIGPEAPKLTNFLGTIGRNGHMCPLNYVQFRALPDEKKEKIWQQVQAKFDIDPRGHAWVMKSVSTAWKNWKALLKAARYNPHDTDEERLADIDERVIPEQWRILVKYWNSEESQQRSSLMKANRARVKLYHTTGPKSFARVREEQRLKRPDGKEPTKADLFILTRTRKDGKHVNGETSKIISQLREKAAQHQGTSEVTTIGDDVFHEVMGEEKPARLRPYGYGPAPAYISDPGPSREEAIKIAAEANTEVREMKEKVMSMEQTCAQMASQMAAILSMVSTIKDKLPDKDTSNPDVSPSEPSRPVLDKDISNLDVSPSEPSHAVSDKDISNPDVSPSEPSHPVLAAEVSGGSARSQRAQTRAGRKRKV